jgi:hypothetical protein
MRLGLLVRAGLLSAGIALAGSALPASAAAATAPVTPESLTTCTGNLTSDPSGAANDEPFLLDYSFQCDTTISAYTVILDQQGDPQGSIDDFNPSPSVLLGDGVTPDATESVTCEGSTPSDGINCNAGAGGVVNLFNFVQGSIDPIQAYCKHLPAKAKPGTAAVPQAVVQLVVTDNTGAQDGPFDLGPAKACAKVPNVVPPATKKKGKSGKSRRG